MKNIYRFFDKKSMFFNIFGEEPNIFQFTPCSKIEKSSKFK